MLPKAIAALAILTVGFGCAGTAKQPAAPQSVPVEIAAVRQQIEAVNARLIAAMEKGDSAAAAGLYDDAAMIMPPGEPGIAGRAEILRSLSSPTSSTISNMKLTVRDLVAGGDLACETGRYEWTVTRKSGDTTPATEVGKYLVIWRKQGDGSYKLFRDMWSSDAPAAPSRK